MLSTVIPVVRRLKASQPNQLDSRQGFRAHRLRINGKFMPEL